MTIGVAEGPGVLVLVGVGEGPGVAVWVGVGEGPDVGVLVGVGEGPGVAVPVGVGLAVAVAVAVGVGMALIVTQLENSELLPSWSVAVDVIPSPVATNPARLMVNAAWPLPFVVINAEARCSWPSP